MTNLNTSRTGLDSFVYWATFVLLVCFVAFFLNSMINLADAEDHQYSTSVDVSNAMARARLHTEHAQVASDTAANTGSPDDLENN